MLNLNKGVADRVCLGLLPSSECSWATAVRALRWSLLITEFFRSCLFLCVFLVVFHKDLNVEAQVSLCCPALMGPTEFIIVAVPLMQQPSAVKEISIVWAGFVRILVMFQTQLGDWMYLLPFGKLYVFLQLVCSPCLTRILTPYKSG